MSLTSLINRPATLRHRTGGTRRDRDGNRVPEVVEVETVCELQQRQRREDADEVSDARWVAFFLPGEIVGTGDELIVDGVSFQVEGDPWPARSPRSRTLSHIEATLRRTAGAEA